MVPRLLRSVGHTAKQLLASLNVIYYLFEEGEPPKINHE